MKEGRKEGKRWKKEADETHAVELELSSDVRVLVGLDGRMIDACGSRVF